MKEEMKWYQWLLSVLIAILSIAMGLGFVWVVAYVITHAAKFALGL